MSRAGRSRDRSPAGQCLKVETCSELKCLKVVR